MEGKVVVVTGAASGMGKATALRFASEGAKVVAADIQADQLHEAAEEIRSGGGQVMTRALDVADRLAVDDMIRESLGRFGRLDAMIANAGIGLSATFLDTSEADLDRVLGVNLKGVFFCGQAAARAMVGSGRGGHIVNVASTYSEVCAPETSAYAASKGAVRMLTKVMALELGPLGIRVNAVAPGWIRTGMNPLDDAVRVAELETAIPLGRVGTPEDVAGVIHFLVSADAGYVNGAMIFVDGGWIVQ